MNIFLISITFWILAGIIAFIDFWKTLANANGKTLHEAIHDMVLRDLLFLLIFCLFGGILCIPSILHLVAMNINWNARIFKE
jgi:hypothetical protein